MFNIVYQCAFNINDGDMVMRVVVVMVIVGVMVMMKW